MTAPVGFADGFASRPALSPREYQMLAAYARTGRQRRAATSTGVSPRTLKFHLDMAYAALNVGGAIEAFRVLGWLTVPEEMA